MRGAASPSWGEIMRVAGTLLAAANVIPLIGVLATPLLFFVSLFFFDSPGSTRDPLVICMALSVWSYPFTAGLGGYRALRAYRAGDLHGMAMWTFCTYSSIALFAACLSIAAVYELTHPG